MSGETASSRRETVIHRIFRVGLYLKAANTVVELASGAALALAPPAAILALARALTRHELLEDPNDLVAGFLLRSAESLSIGQESAAAIFLLSHGGVKLFLVAMVLRGHPWAYPLFMAALCLLITYQSYQLSLGWSLWLGALTVLDVVVLALTWHEFRLHRAAGDW